MDKKYQLGKIQAIPLLKNRVYEEIKESIIKLAFLPGEQLVEQRLADELGVSKSPIRDAFQRLEQEGLVFSIPYRGCFVSPISTQECRDLFQLREALEIYCLDNCFFLYTDDDIREFERIMDDAVQLMDGSQEYAAYRKHLSFHYLIIHKSNNHMIESTYSSMFDKMRRYIDIVVRLDPNRVMLSSHQHRDLLQAIRDKDKDAAVRALRLHLSTVLEDYIRLITEGNIVERASLHLEQTASS